jgi:trimethylamine--corrinoid protein Co-methyltransferase
MVYESVGMHASLLGFCFESLVLGNDMLGQVLRCVRGIEVTEDTVNIDVIREVCLDGPGHYLGHAQTLELMQRDYVYPEVADRTSPKEWEELGKPKLLEKATARVEQILSSPETRLIDPEIDAAIRKRFNICF